MNRRKFSASVSRMARGSIIGGLMCAFQFAACSAVAEEIPENKTVLASVNVPAPGLSCDDAAARASVTFKVVGAPFTVQRYSVFIDGDGLPESAVDEAWPSIAVQHGFHPGRNLIEFILYGADNQSLDRKQTLLIGASPNSGDVAPAQINCAGSVAQDDESAWPALALNGTGQAAGPLSGDQNGNQGADEPPPVIESTPTYFDGPIYTYYPAPVFFGPVFSAGYFSAPLIIYSPRPPLYYDNRRGPHYRPGSVSNARPGRDSAAPPRSYGDTSNNESAFGQTGENHSGAAHRGTFSTYSPPAYGGSTPSSGKAGKSNIPAFVDNGGDRRNAGAPYNAERGYGAVPIYDAGNRAGNVLHAPQQLPPPSRQLTPPQQLPLPSQRFGTPPPQAPPRPAENHSQSPQGKP